MTIGTKFFNDTNIQTFKNLNGKIAQLQDDISRGTNNPKASADPVRAMRLSVANEQMDLLDRFDRNLDTIKGRLDITDQSLGKLGDLSQRLREIAVWGISDTIGTGERASLRIEVEELQKAALNLANSTDAMGRSLFGGYRNAKAPFAETNGEVAYIGDRGTHKLRISESASLNSGVDGATIFMAVETENGTQDFFSILDDLKFALEEETEKFTSTASLSNSAKVEVKATRAVENWSMTITGPSGSATITAPISLSSYGAMVDAINEMSAQTGVTATSDASGMVLAAGLGAQFELSNITPENTRRESVATVQSLDGDGLAVGPAHSMIATRLDTAAQLQQISDLNAHVIDRRAEAGAQSQVAKWQQESIVERRVLLEHSIAELESLDIAEAITNIQTLMLGRDAAQQTFAKVIQQTLFDYIR